MSKTRLWSYVLEALIWRSTFTPASVTGVEIGRTTNHTNWGPLDVPPAERVHKLIQLKKFEFEQKMHLPFNAASFNPDLTFLIPVSFSETFFERQNFRHNNYNYYYWLPQRTVRPDLEKFCHFGKILTVFGYSQWLILHLAKFWTPTLENLLCSKAKFLCWTWPSQILIKIYIHLWSIL